ncbi:MAG: F0F1 ATP synthase subunit A [Peptococcaceae bacterium]|nr:F0F1 ATP synthase subunit A [Peptococcaceae bacterium]
MAQAAGKGAGSIIERAGEAVDIWNFPQEPWHLGTVLGYPVDVNAPTMVFTWVTMALVLFLAVLAARGADVRRPSRLAVAFEELFELVRSLIDENFDREKGRGLLALMVTLLLFITVANLLGVVPAFSAPTADHNTTFALAGIIFVLSYVLGIRYRGGEFLRDFLKPFAFFLPVRLIEEVARPTTLAMRLFGNIKAKEVMILALLGIITGTAEIAGGFLASVVWLGFSVFLSFIQAFIFMMLSIAYIAMAVSGE